MTIRGLPRPLPECSRCQTPVRRARASLTRGICSSCLTPAEAMAARHREIHAAKLGDGETSLRGRRKTDARIDQLAAKRQERAARLAAGATS